MAESFDPDALIAAARETPELTAVLLRFAALVDGQPALGSARPAQAPGSGRLARLGRREEGVGR